MFFWTHSRCPNSMFNFDRDLAEEVTPEEYIEIYQTERENIGGVFVLPANWGSRNFGRILIRRKRPNYKYLNRGVAKQEYTR